MPLTDDQTEVLARDLMTIARCARALHAQLNPGHQARAEIAPFAATIADAYRR